MHSSRSTSSRSAKDESPYTELIRQNPRLANAKIYSPDGTYLGKLSTDKHDPESISNPCGQYGSALGNTVNNPYGTYGNKYSSKCWYNPYATDPPYLVGADGSVLGTIVFK